MNLYEINELIKIAIESGIMIDSETGEILELKEGDLNALKCNLEDKIENIGLYIKNTESFSEALNLEKKNLEKRIKASNAKSEFLRKYLSNFMIGNNKYKFETSKIKLSFRNSSSVEIVDGFDNKEFMRVKYEVDKKSISEKLKDGIKIDGALLVEKQNLQIK